MANLYDTQHKFVGTWVPVEDVAFLSKLAKANKVSLAAYVRAIIVDAVEEERAAIPSRPKLVNSDNTIAV